MFTRAYLPFFQCCLPSSVQSIFWSIVLSSKIIPFCLQPPFPLLFCLLYDGIEIQVEDIVVLRWWCTLILLNHIVFCLPCSSIAWGLYWLNPLDSPVIEGLRLSVSAFSFSKPFNRCFSSLVGSSSTLACLDLENLGRTLTNYLCCDCLLFKCDWTTNTYQISLHWRNVPDSKSMKDHSAPSYIDKRQLGLPSFWSAPPLRLSDCSHASFTILSSSRSPRKIDASWVFIKVFYITA